MKKLITILAVMVVLVGAVFADAPANGDTDSLNVTLTIAELQPTLTLMGSTDNSTFSHAEVAFGSLEADAKSITAYFRVDYTLYRWNKSITVSVEAGSLTSTTVADTAAPDSTNPTLTNATKNFSGADAAGSFAAFSVTWNVANLSAASYSAPVTVTYTVG